MVDTVAPVGASGWQKLIPLRLVLPVACGWARRHEAKILQAGQPLKAAQLADAARIGVRAPERVRILEVEKVPPGLKLGFEHTIGMALGHGIYLRREHAHERELLLHELAHVAQYERLGMRRFLRQYLHECFTEGYPLGALEAEARDVTQKLV